MNEGALVDIYGLYEPDGETLRYVGKANCAAKRLKTHIRESRTIKRPVCKWINSLIAGGNLPVLKVIESVPQDQWEEAERRLIAHYRLSADLLNLADGGARPSMTKDQRKQSGIRLHKANSEKSPQEKNLIKAKQCYARLATQFRKSGDVFRYWCMRFKMHRMAVEKPHLFGDWIIHGR